MLPSGSLCLYPGEELVIDCTVQEFALRWRITQQSTTLPSIEATLTSTSQPSLHELMIGDAHFIINRTSTTTDSGLTSKLKTSVTNHLNGTIIECISNGMSLEATITIKGMIIVA